MSEGKVRARNRGRRIRRNRKRKKGSRIEEGAAIARSPEEVSEGKQNKNADVNGRRRRTKVGVVKRRRMSVMNERKRTF